MCSNSISIATFINYNTNLIKFKIKWKYNGRISNNIALVSYERVFNILIKFQTSDKKYCFFTFTVYHMLRRQLFVQKIVLVMSKKSVNTIIINVSIDRNRNRFINSPFCLTQLRIY